MENIKQKAIPTYDKELKTWTILFPMVEDNISLGKTASKGELPVRFYQFNGFPYALIAIENNCKSPINVAIKEYKNSVSDIKNENNYYPVELSIDESLELYKHEHINDFKDEDEKIENFFKSIDFDKYKTITDIHSAILLIDKNLIGSQYK